MDQNNKTPFPSVVTEFGQIDRNPSSVVVYNWEIQNFDTICPKDEDTFEFETQVSETFIAGEDIGKQSLWYAECVYEDDGLCLHLHLSQMGLSDGSSSSCFPVSIKLTLCVMSASGDDVLRGWENYASYTDASEVHRITIVENVTELWENESTYLEGNTLRLKICLEIFGRKTEKLEPVVRLRQVEGVANMKKKLHADLKTLYNNEATSDTTVHCGQTTFFVHRAILAARSKYFAAMFDHDMKGAQNNRIDITDFEPAVVDAGLRYIYDADVEAVVSTTDDSMIENVIPFADKYALAELKSFCFQRLIAKMDVDRFGSFAVLVHLHGTDERGLDVYVENYMSTKWSTLKGNKFFFECMKEHLQAFVGKAVGHKSATEPSKGAEDAGDGDKTESTSKAL